MVNIIISAEQKIGSAYGRIVGFCAKLFGSNIHAGRLSIRIGMAEQHLCRTRSINSIGDGAAYKWKRFNRQIAIIPALEPNAHMLIVGMSGYGKSTLFKSILSDVAGAGKAVVVFDAHGEHHSAVKALNGKVYDAAYSGIELLELDGATVDQRIREVVALFKSVYSLGDLQASKLALCLGYVYGRCGAPTRFATALRRTPTITDLLYEIRIFINNAKTKSEANSLINMRDRLSMLDNPTFRKADADIINLRSGVCCFSLSHIRNKEMQLIYISELLRRLYTSMKHHRIEQGPSMCIMIDEAQFIINGNDDSGVIVRNLIEEGRKYGIFVVIATHTASSLERTIVANCATFVTFYSREPHEVNYVASLLGGGDPQKSAAVRIRLSRLKQNELLIVSGLITTPTVVLSKRLIQKHGQQAPASIDKQQTINQLRYLLKKPVKTVDIDSEILGRINEYQLNDGIIDSVTISHGDMEQKWLMFHNPALSIEHEAYISTIHGLLLKRSINARIAGGPNAPDLIVQTYSKPIAVEYETGKKQLEYTVQMVERRKAAYQYVVVVVNDTAFEPFKTALSKQHVMVFPASHLIAAIECISALSSGVRSVEEQ